LSGAEDRTIHQPLTPLSVGESQRILAEEGSSDRIVSRKPNETALIDAPQKALLE
jgi:hypothetical protein